MADATAIADDDHQATTSSTSTPSFRFRWDVFLSFRGEDTRHTFTERLYTELVRNGIRTFRDDEELEQGEEIAPSLLEAIEDSAASIAIISKNYASSRWCLEELAKILECRRLILPVFYQVDPSDVRRQKGPFEEAFRNLDIRFGEDKVIRWRKAMEKAGGISGWDSRIWEEPQLIQSLVKKVLNKLSNTPLGVAKYPVGLNSRLGEVMRILDVKANGVRVLGLHGMGGVGKTTLAKAVYNKLVIHFKRRSFISNVRETWGQHNGLKSLQDKLMGDLSIRALPPVNEVSRDIMSIKELIPEEPILVVLDDVDDVRQLNALAGKRDWFFEGSRLIITTRNIEVLPETIVDKFYEVKELHFPESLQLFSYHAFGRDKPTSAFIDLSKQVVSLAGGLPLALEVFGSYLFDKRTKKEWDDALQKLKQIRPGHLQDVLEISFNALDEQEKCIFLDIACFFVQMKMKRDDAIDILKGCGFSAEIAITDLTNKSLVKIIENNSLWMHDQLRDMGRQIVQHENLEDPGMRSRLWDHDEVMTVLKNKKGTRNIRGIVLDFEKKHEVSSEKNHWTNLKRMPGFSSAMTYLKEIYKTRIHRGAEKDKNIMLRSKSFEPMVNLRLLQINHVKLAGNFKFMAATLKWLQWEGCPLKSLPSEFCPRDLAVLNLSRSKITQVWDWRWWNMYRNKMADKLLVMNLHDCWYLTDIPNLSGHRVLEKLILENCVRLVKVHKSVGDLTSLLYLNLKNCSNLVEFPTDVSGLKHLENLNLSGCLKLKELPEDMGSMKSLRELLVDDTAIVNLPDSIFRLKKLERLSLMNCRSLKQLPVCVGKLCSLRELYLDGSALEEIPDSVGSLTNLEKLRLVSCRSLTAIPDSVGNLKSLLELFLDSSSIKELPISIGSLSHLKFLSITRCRSLTKLPDSINGLASLVQFWLQGTSITEISDQVGALNMLEKLDMGNCKSLRSLPDSIGNMLNLTTLILDGAVITELPESIGELERLDTLRMDYCKHLRRLPASIGKLKNLRRLQMGETAVTELPEELGMLSSLTTLKMRKSHEHLTNIGEHAEMTNLTPQEKPKFVGLPMSFLSLSSLTELDARAWGISGKIPDDFEKLSLLETLDLGYNNISSLPSSLRGLSILQVLFLSHCKELKSLPPLPLSLLKLNVTNCTALENIFDLSNLESLHELQLTNCRKIMDIPGLQCLRSLRTLYTSGCNACVPAIKRRLTKVALKHLSNLSVPGSEIPNWFVREIPSFSSRKNRDIKGVIIGVVVSFDQHSQDSFRDKASAIENVQAKIIRLDKPIFTTVLFSMEVPDTNEDQLYICRCSKSRPIVFMLRDGDKIQVALRDDPNFKGFELKKYGIHLIFEDDDDIEEDDEEWLDESQQSVSYKLAKFFNSL